MANEPVEVQLARFDGRMEMILRELQDARTGRREQYERIESLTQSVMSIGTKVENVETKLAGQAPTIEEFITIKHKVVGAGQLGKWVWAIGGVLIGVIFSTRKTLGQWLLSL